MPIARPAASVALEGFELRVLQIPLVSPFTTSFGTETVREVIVVRALTADGDGWGEIVTGAAPLYSSEYTQGAWDVALRWLDPRAARPPHASRPRRSPASLAPVRRPPHGQGRPRARRARRRAAQPRAARSASTSAPCATACRRACRSASSATRRRSSRSSRGYLDEGYVRIKIKIKPGRDIAETAAVREAFGAHPAAGRRQLRLHARRRRHPRRARPLRPAADRAAAAGGRPRRPRDPRPAPAHAGLPGRVDRVAQGRGRRARAGRGIRHQHQGRARRRLPRGGRDPRPVPGCRHPGVVRRHARDRHRPRGERRARRAARASRCRATCRRRAASTRATS